MMLYLGSTLTQDFLRLVPTRTIVPVDIQNLGYQTSLYLDTKLLIYNLRDLFFPSTNI